MPVLANPAPNTVVDGHIHSGNVTDNFQYIFNERIVNPDGSVTVRVAHQRFLGPNAVGDLIIGQSICGRTGVGSALPPPTIPPDPPGSGSPGSGQPQPPAAADTTAPQLASVSVSPAAFRAAPSGPSIAARVGSTVSYTLSEEASVNFVVQRSQPGRRVKGQCVKPRPGNRQAKGCTRYVDLPGAFAHSGKAGQNRFQFSGRLGRRKLRPGRYRLSATATDPAGNRSSTQAKPFVIASR